MRSIPIVLCTAVAAVGCKPEADVPRQSLTVAVQATAETAPVGTSNKDAADDPAIWRNPANPAASLIVATDKQAGLHVYDLTGKERSFDAAGRINNVGLVDLGGRGILVAASDRNDDDNARLRLYRLDPDGPKLVSLGTVPVGKGEAYGICLGRAANGTIHAFLVLKEGHIEQLALSFDGTSAQGRIVRSLSVPSQSEGCVVDMRTGQLFVGEEKVGIWKFEAAADAPASGQLVAEVDGDHLSADVEGLALAPEGADGGYLIASSQGDDSFALYRLPDMVPAGRFRIARGRFGSVEETDGIALVLGDFGQAFPGGLFVAQDGENQPRAQNFKLLPWAAILGAMEKR